MREFRIGRFADSVRSYRLFTANIASRDCQARECRPPYPIVGAHRVREDFEG
jgi:hypothetical protein